MLLIFHSLGNLIVKIIVLKGIFKNKQKSFRKVFCFFILCSRIELFLNYTKLATFAIKAYLGKKEINLAKILTPVGIESENSCDPLGYLPD